MDILVLGGGGFLGWAVAAQAVAAGHDVVTFTRGRWSLPAGVEAVHGDRADPGALAGRRFDAVVDTSGQVPAEVLAGATLLAGAAPHYVYVSSLSANPGWPADPVDPASPTFPCPPDAGADAGEYGMLKAGCERAVLAAFGPNRSTVVRSGLIIGPREDRNSPRLPWWLHRISQGGEVLCPGERDRPFLAVDVRDLASWLLHCAQERVAGTFCTDPPPDRATSIELFDACRSATGAYAVFSWVDDDLLVEQGVEPWTELPFWLPPGMGTRVVDASAAHAAGLRCRPLRHTVVDTWASMRAGETGVGDEHRPDRPRVGLEPAKEAAVLAAARAARRWVRPGQVTGLPSDFT